MSSRKEPNKSDFGILQITQYISLDSKKLAELLDLYHKKHPDEDLFLFEEKEIPLQKMKAKPDERPSTQPSPHKRGIRTLHLACSINPVVAEWLLKRAPEKEDKTENLLIDPISGLHALVALAAYQQHKDAHPDMIQARNNAIGLIVSKIPDDESRKLYFLEALYRASLKNNGEFCDQLCKAVPLSFLLSLPEFISGKKVVFGEPEIKRRAGSSSMSFFSEERFIMEVVPALYNAAIKLYGYKALANNNENLFWKTMRDLYIPKLKKVLSDEYNRTQTESRWQYLLKWLKTSAVFLSNEPDSRDIILKMKQLSDRYKTRFSATISKKFLGDIADQALDSLRENARPEELSVLWEFHNIWYQNEYKNSALETARFLLARSKEAVYQNGAWKPLFEKYIVPSNPSAFTFSIALTEFTFSVSLLCAPYRAYARNNWTAKGIKPLIEDLRKAYKNPYNPNDTLELLIEKGMEGLRFLDVIDPENSADRSELLTFFRNSAAGYREPDTGTLTIPMVMAIGKKPFTNDDINTLIKRFNLQESAALTYTDGDTIRYTLADILVGAGRLDITKALLEKGIIIPLNITSDTKNEIFKIARMIEQLSPKADAKDETRRDPDIASQRVLDLWTIHNIMRGLITKNPYATKSAISSILTRLKSWPEDLQFLTSLFSFSVSPLGEWKTMCAEHQIDITRYLPKYDAEQTEPSSDAEILQRITILAGQLSNQQWRINLTSAAAACQATIPQPRVDNEAKAAATSAGTLFAVASPLFPQQPTAPAESGPTPNPSGKP